MGAIIGPTAWWQNNLIRACPVGTILPDGSALICKSGGGIAWIVAPYCTQVASQWAGGQYNSTLVGDKCCISEWPALNTLMLQLGFNPTDWFIPSCSLLLNPGYVCRAYWDTFLNTTSKYWSSTETNAFCSFCLSSPSGTFGASQKNDPAPARAFRCVTY
jgi:hypothetical protein